MKKKLVAFMLACSLAAGQGAAMFPVHAAQAQEEMGETAGGVDSGAVTQEQMDEGDYTAGAASDISISNVSVSGGTGGSKATVNFTVTGNRNNKKKYEVDSIVQVYPVLDESFPFETNDAAYKVTTGTGNTLQCSYTFNVKDNVETAYYPVSFVVVYGRKNTTGGTGNYADRDYGVTKSLSVKLTAQKTTEEPASTETVEEAQDVSIVVDKTPEGTYSQNCKVNFMVKSNSYKIKSVTPVISETFPFETKGDAYKTISSKGKSKLNCSYNFKVRSDVATGYQPVTFNITYVKNKTTLNTTCSLNVKLNGKKEKKSDVSASEKKNKSVPRLMVVGYETDVEEIHPNSEFNLILKMQNNAKVTVSNIKFTLSTANGEFLPVSGASTAFKDSIAAGQTANISFRMKANASLGSKSYPITIKSEYENNSADAFTAEDSVSIPVVVEDRIKLTEIEVPELLSVGGSSNVSFSINNLGSATLNNVTVSCEGEGFSCEESYLGNIAAGGTGYGDVTLNGEEITPDDSDGEAKIVIRYENATGESKTYEEKINVLVSEEEMDEMMDEAMMEEMAANSGGFNGLFVVVLLIIVVAVVIVVLKVRKKKRLKKEEEELMGDDLL